MADADTAHPPSLDLEASPVQGQLASAVLDLQGEMLRGPLPPQDAFLLYQMLVEAGNLKNLENFTRLTVTFPSMRYVVARDESHIYIVQTRT
jgi:hypothetical protein